MFVLSYLILLNCRFNMCWSSALEKKSDGEEDIVNCQSVKDNANQRASVGVVFSGLVFNYKPSRIYIMSESNSVHAAEYSCL